MGTPGRRRLPSVSDALSVALAAGWLALIGTGLTIAGNWYVSGGRDQRARQQMKEELELLSLIEARSGRMGPDPKAVAALKRRLEEGLEKYTGTSPTATRDSTTSRRRPSASELAERADAAWSAATIAAFSVSLALLGLFLADQVGATPESPLIGDWRRGLLAATVIPSWWLLIWGLMRGLRALIRKGRGREK